jgi:class 3 adenylate cyclase
VAEKILDSRSTLEGERKQVTVLFCDLVGSTEIAATLDPEDWHRISQAYQHAAAAAVRRFGGHVDKFLGDGLVCFFGVPQVHEDDAERAVRAGLAIVEAVRALGGGPHPGPPPLPEVATGEGTEIPSPASISASGGGSGWGPVLHVRVGIHTGPAVVAHGGGESKDVFGDPPNIAARAQSVAEPDTVVITAATHRLVAGLFVVNDLGAPTLKGVREPVQLYRVLQGSGVRGRLHAAAAHGLTPFVGREDERRLLRTRWELACDGDGQVVLVSGEAGIGKSRLVQQFKEDLGATPHTWIECAGSPYLANTPFHAISDLLQRGLTVEGDAGAEERLERLESGLVLAGLEAPKAVPLMAPLFGLPVPERYPPLLLTPEQQRRKQMATLLAWTVGIARLQPLVLVFEDLHYVDPSTLEFLGLLVEQGATAPLLLLLTARPEFRAAWPMRSHHAQITLTRLSRRQVRELVERVAARAVLAQEMVEAVVARTDGVPLFVEEFVRLLLEGEGPALVREIPATLQDSLMARLDRLGAAKEVAQVGAVLGHEFSYTLLHAVAPRPEAELQAALDRLVDAELVYARGVAPEATYLFKHTLMQDAAYASLLKSRRRELHRATARTLMEKFPEMAEAQPELLAHHHAEAGDVELAVAAWQRAGDRAAARSALVEAVGRYGKALELLGGLPDTPARARQELELRASSGLALRATKGWDSPEATEAYARARQLSEQLGDVQQLVVVLQGLWTASIIAGDLRTAQDLADQMLRVAEGDGTAATMVWPHVTQGLSRFMRGDVRGSLDHFDRALALYQEEQHRSAPIDPGVAALSLGASPLAYAGLADGARQRVRSGLALAQRIGRPYELAQAWMGGALLNTALRDPDGVREHTEALLQLAAAHQFRRFAALAGMHHGWALAHQGRHDEGIAQLRRSLGKFLASGQFFLQQYPGMLADAYLQADAPAEALAAIEDDLAGARSEEEIFLPEVLRIRGDALAAAGSATTQVEATYREALGLAHRVGNKLIELRAAVSLGRLLQSHGRAAEARALLAPLYAAFTEGFDTRDLTEAKALLDELS